MLLLGSEEEMLEELRGRQLTSTSQFDDFGNVLNHIDDLHLFVELQSFLRVITETDGFTNIQCTRIGLLFAHQYLDESGFSRTVIAHDTHLLITGKDVGEIL